MTKEIKLANSEKVAIVDDFLYEWLSIWEWSISTAGYAMRRTMINREDCSIVMHRAILQMLSCSIEVDHMDGDRLNNQMSNLREATRRQNSYNRPGINKTSAFKGVRWNKSKRKWYVQITVSGEKLHLGGYSDEEMAARVYDAAARFYANEFAWTNFDGEAAMSAADIKRHKQQGTLSLALKK